MLRKEFFTARAKQANKESENTEIREAFPKLQFLGKLPEIYIKKRVFYRFVVSFSRN
jgi:hypothetical protein